MLLIRCSSPGRDEDKLLSFNGCSCCRQPDSLHSDIIRGCTSETSVIEFSINMIHILIIVIYFEYHTSFIVILLLLAFYLLKTLYFHIAFFYIENQQSFFAFYFWFDHSPLTIFIQQSTLKNQIFSFITLLWKPSNFSKCTFDFRLVVGKILTLLVTSIYFGKSNRF